MARKSVAERKTEGRERFLRLAPKRVNAARKAIRLVGNCSVPSGYEYGEQEARKVVAALREAVDEVEARFNKTEQDDDSFTL